MGCDIHAVLEVQHANGSLLEWETLAVLHLPRQYAVFCALAGVRCRDGREPQALRGVPSDLSYRARSHYHDWASDAHSQHWLTAAEFAAVIATLNAEDKWGANHEYDDLATMLKALDTAGVTARVVFWFDN